MERQCHHCNAAVPEGAPFCAACGAPQIRVVAPQTAPPPAPEHGFTAPPLPPPAYGSAAHVSWGTAFKKCLIAAATLIAVLMLLRVPLLIFLAIPAGGWFAAYLYSRSLPVTGGIGARIGAVTGLIAYVFYALITAAAMVFQRERLLDEVKRAMTEAASRNPDPQAQQIVQKMMTPEGIAVLITLGAIVMLFMFLILSSVGGAIGGATSKGRTSTSA